MSPRTLHVDALESTPGALRAAVHFLRARGHSVQVESWEESAFGSADVRVVELPDNIAESLTRLKTIAVRNGGTRTVLVGPQGLESLSRATGFGHAAWLQRPIDLDRLIEAIEDPAQRHAHELGRVTFERKYPARRSSVESAPRDLIAWALRSSVSPAARARIATACAEVIDNACRHAHAADGPAEAGTEEARPHPELEIRAALDERQLEITIRDFGCGFATEGLDLSSSKGGGLARASALSEAMRVESSPQTGTSVHLVFSVSVVHLAGERSLDLSDLDFLLPSDARLLLDACSRSDGADAFHLSPALAVCVGRLLAGPDPRRALRTALSS